MAARAGVEPTTLRLRVIASTNAPPCPTVAHYVIRVLLYELLSHWDRRLHFGEVII